MSAATMTLGGPLSIACTFCCAAPRERCTRLPVPGVTSRFARATATHAVRVKAAPPAEEVGAGDLMLVQLAPGKGAKHLLALLVEPGDTPLVRLWRGGPAAFASPRRVVRTALLRKAPADDPRVAPARVFLAELLPARGRVFDTKAHGRIWIVDADASSVRWDVVGSQENGMIALEEWLRAALAGEITAVATVTGAPLLIPSGEQLAAADIAPYHREIERGELRASTPAEPSWTAPEGW